MTGVQTCALPICWLVTSLAPQGSRPSERTFRHPDVVSHALRIRAQTLRDVVGVIAGYVESGERMPSATRFARWDSLVRQPLIWAGASDMSRNFANNAAMSEKGSALIEVLSVLHDRFGTKEFTSTQVANLRPRSNEWHMEGEPGADDSLSRLQEGLTTLGAQQPSNPASQQARIVGACAHRDRRQGVHHHDRRRSTRHRERCGLAPQEVGRHQPVPDRTLNAGRWGSPPPSPSCQTQTSQFLMRHSHCQPCTKVDLCPTF